MDKGQIDANGGGPAPVTIQRHHKNNGILPATLRCKSTIQSFNVRKQHASHAGKTGPLRKKKYTDIILFTADWVSKRILETIVDECNHLVCQTASLGPKMSQFHTTL